MPCNMTQSLWFWWTLIIQVCILPATSVTWSTKVTEYHTYSSRRGNAFPPQSLPPASREVRQHCAFASLAKFPGRLLRMLQRSPRLELHMNRLKFGDCFVTSPRGLRKGPSHHNCVGWR